MPAANSQANDEKRFRREFLIATLASGVVLGAVYLYYPGVDIAFSSALRDACGGDDRHSGWCHENGILRVPRYFAIACSAASIAAAAFVLMRSVARYGRLLGNEKFRCLVLLASFAAGPGLLTNTVLKDNWGRARPREVVQFGGKNQFTPPLTPAHECADNCSFVSGEAASVYAPFFAAALLFPQLRIALMVGGVVAGTAAGLVRISTGGHFLSDVLFAGVFMALTVSFVHAVILGFWTRRRVDGPQQVQSKPWLDNSMNEGLFATNIRRHQ